MSDDRKRAGSGAMVVPTPSDDRQHSSASSASAKKVIIKSADMKEDLQREAVDIAIAAFDKHNVEKDVAEAIKKEFDRKHGPTWHCIVGKNFGKKMITTFVSAVGFINILFQLEEVGPASKCK